MAEILSTIFVHPILRSPVTSMYMLIPLCLAIATIYKTLRTDDPRKLPYQIAKWTVMVLAFGVLLGLGIYVLQYIFLHWG